MRLQDDHDLIVERDHAPGACLRFRLADGEPLLMDEVDLLPSEFAQVLVAQSAIQISYESGYMFLLCNFAASNLTSMPAFSSAV